MNEECVVCFEEKEKILLKCGHSGCCATCINQIIVFNQNNGQKAFCPLGCNSEIIIRGKLRDKNKNKRDFVTKTTRLKRIKVKYPHHKIINGIQHTRCKSCKIYHPMDHCPITNPKFFYSNSYHEDSNDDNDDNNDDNIELGITQAELLTIFSN